MTTIDRDRARALARRAYERGRAVRALPTAAYALPMVALAIAVRAWQGPSSVSLGIVGAGVALVAAVFVMAWRGGALGRAIGPGLLAGVPPFAVPLVLHAMGHGCALGACMTPACSAICLPACAAGGALAGVVVGVATVTEWERPLATLGGASVVAILAGSLGCWFAGVSGVLGMAVATLGATAPVVLVRARRV